MSLPNACLRLVATLCGGRTASAVANGLMRALRRTAMAALALLACTGLAQAATIAAGDGHTLEIRQGLLFAWGANYHGQLGDGTTDQRNSPVRVSLPGGVTPVAVAAGSSHSLAIGSDGKLYAWGYNAYGQLGDGTTNQRFTPGVVNLPAGVTPTAVAAGYGHSLAIGSDGKLYAWGYNGQGQLGNGTYDYGSTSPVVVNLPAGVTPTAVAAGGSHSLALGSDGKLYAWGRNDFGQLGDGTTNQQTTPVIVNLPAGVTPTAVAAGSIHSLAIGSDGKLYAWGYNGSGELGNGTNNYGPNTTPTVVNLPAGVTPTAVAAGQSHSLAIGSDGKLYAWGYNGNGQLGDGTYNQQNTPVIVNLPAGVTPTAVAAGSSHSLAIGSDGKLYAWGYNGSGQLGDGSYNQQTTPASVSDLAYPIWLASSPNPSLLGNAVTVTATVIGNLPTGSVQFKDGAAVLGEPVTLVDGRASISVSSLALGVHALGADYSGDANNAAKSSQGPQFQRVVPSLNQPQIAAGQSHSLEIRGSQLYAWGNNDQGQLGDGTTSRKTASVPVKLPAGVTPTAVAAGSSHSLAIGSDAKLYAWGYNGYGQLGDGSYNQQTTPVVVKLPTGVTPTAVAAGSNHSLAIGSDGKLYAWGYNGNGQLGVVDPSCCQRNTPGVVNLPAGVTPTAMAAGYGHSLAIGSDGQLYAWGGNGQGQLGDGTLNQRNTPALVNLPAGVTPVAVAAGSSHSLAIGFDGKLYAWGNNGQGQLGDGTTTQQTTPVIVSLPAGVIPTAVAAGEYHSLAMGSDGKLYAWGYNGSGQLGDGTGSQQFTPVMVNLPGVAPTAVAAGTYHSLALGSDGKLYAWGNNYSGQLGDGTTGQRNSPTSLNAYGTTTQLLSSPNPSAPGQTVTLSASVSGGGLYSAPTGTVQFKDGDALLVDAQPLVGGSASLVVSTLTLGRHALSAVYSGDSLSVPSTGLASHAVQRPARIASGGNYTLEIIDGKLYGWGYNGSGQLGDGTTTNHASRGQVLLPAGVVPVAVAAGDAHSLALAADGSLYAWGDNHYGQLGDGSTVNRSTPVRVALPAGVTAVAMAAGYDHSLALGSDGQLYAWGSNASGQLGDYTTVNRRSPVRARLPAGVTPALLAAGFESSLMIATDGQVYAWGNNSVGQLGDGSTTPRSAPVLAGLPAGITAIELAARDLHALAIGSDGQVYAWGYNAEGQLGDGTTTNRSTPVVAALPAGVTAVDVSAGSGHSLAIGSDGLVYAWGRNLDGQLGNGSSTAHSTPVALSLPGGSVPTEISAGIDHSVAMIAGGEAFGWGYNDYGQLGNGGTTERDTPTPVGGYTSQTQLVASPGASRLGRPVTLTATVIGGTPTGTVQFKDGATNLGAAVPLVDGSASIVTSALAVGVHPLTAVYSGDAQNTASTSGVVRHQVRVNFLAAGGTGYAAYDGLALVGRNDRPYVVRPGPGASPGTASERPVAERGVWPDGVGSGELATGGSHSLAVGFDGKLYAWGNNGSGQLGDGTTNWRYTPGVVNLPAGVAPAAVTAGSSHSLAIGSDGKLYAWGNNGQGQLGNGVYDYGANATPIAVSLPAGARPIAVAAGSSHSLAIGSDGKLYAWGNNQTTPVVVDLPAGVTPTEVAAGGSHSLAIGSDGKLYAWGYNGRGQLGDGTTAPRATPSVVSLPEGVTPVAVAAGSEHSLVLGSNGKLYSWGGDSAGQLGRGVGCSGDEILFESCYRPVPAEVAMPAGVSAIEVAAGGSISLATGSDGRVYVWGGSGGWLGIGSITARNTPVALIWPSQAQLVVTPSATYQGEPVTLTATVSGDDGVPSGTVQFMDGATTLGEPQPLVGGTASLAVSALSAGGHQLTVVYSGDSGNQGSTSAAVAHTVLQRITIAGGNTHSLQIRDGSLRSFGGNAAGQLGDGSTVARSMAGTVALPGAAVPVQVAAGAAHSLVLASDGQAFAFGSNASGQLGDGSTTQRNSAVAVLMPAGMTFTTLAAGAQHSLAIGSNATVYAWGANESGQLGDGSTTQRTAPVAVGLPAGITPAALAAGLQHSLALGSDGQLYGWGANLYGQLGDGSTTQRNSPVAVSLATGVSAVAVAAGDQHSLAIGSDDKLYAWGYNNRGQLGDGTTTRRTAPVVVNLPAGVTPRALAAGSLHSLALGSDGQVYAWGRNANGQLGDGSTTQRTSPVALSLPAGVTALAIEAGASHSLALGSDGKLYSWGLNDAGQLGNGSTAQRLSPNAVPTYDSQTVLESSTNPSAVGQLVILSVEVVGNAPTGTVQFKDGSTNLGGPVELAFEQAYFSTYALTAGSHRITAVYSGDANNLGSSSAVLTQVVGQAAGGVVLQLSSATLAPGQLITLTATVSGTAPTGTVQFKDGSNNLGGPVELFGGVASYSTNALAVGVHSITAVYSGDASNAGSTSAPASLTVGSGSGGSGGGSGGAASGDIPTLPEWGLILLACVLLVVAERQRGVRRPARRGGRG